MDLELAPGRAPGDVGRGEIQRRHGGGEVRRRSITDANRRGIPGVFGDGLWSETRVRATGQRLETGRELLRTPIAVGLDFGLCRRVGVEFSTRGTSPQRCGC